MLHIMIWTKKKTYIFNKTNPNVLIQGFLFNIDENTFCFLFLLETLCSKQNTYYDYQLKKFKKSWINRLSTIIWKKI